MTSAVAFAARTIADYLGFYTNGAPTTTVVQAEDGTLTTTTTTTPTLYVSPNVTMEMTFIAELRLGTPASTGVAAALPATFTSFELHTLDYNPPLASFTMSKITGVCLRLSPAPYDVDWAAGIWSHLPSTGRGYGAVARRAPSAIWSWRSNVTMPQAVEHTIPWPHGRPVADSVHAVMPGLHQPALQIGMWNQPHHTAVPLPAGEIIGYVMLTCEVAGLGMLGTI